MGVMLSAAFALTNCTSEMDQPVQAPSAEGAFEIIAKTADTKTVNDGMSTLWEGGDTINVFHAAAGSEDYVNDGMFTIAEADVEDGRFTGDLGAAVEADGTYDWYAFFPYTEQKESPADATSGYAYIGYSKGLNQTGYDNMGALRGSVCPLYGVAKAVAGDKVPGMTMQHLSSAVAVQITNENEEPLTIKTVSFTAPEPIVGSFYMTFADGEPTYVPSGDTYVNSTAVVNVKEGTALAKGESATVYIAIKPFTAVTDDDLTLVVNGYEKYLTMTNDVTFHAGKIKTLKFKYDYVPKGKTVTFDFNANEWDLPLSAQDAGKQDLGNIVEPVVSGDVAMTAYNPEGAKTKIRMWQGSSTVDLRAYKGSSLAFSVPEGFVITKVTLDGSDIGDNVFTIPSGTYASKVWTGKSNPVIFTVKSDAEATVKLNAVTVEYEAGTGDSPELPEQGEPSEPEEPEQPEDPSDVQAITVAEFNGLEDGDTVYELTGTITEIYQEYNSQYNNVSFYIEDETGKVLIFRMSCEGVDDPSAITVGDEITVQGKKTTYNGSAQMASGGKYISHTDKAAPTPEEPGEAETVTLAEFLAAETSTTQLYRISGEIVSISEMSTQYNNATLTLSDGTTSVYVYRMKPKTGDSIDQIGLTLGDILTVEGNRGDYNGDPQMTNGVYVSHEDVVVEEPNDAYTLLFGASYNSQSVSSYTDTWTVTNEGFTATMQNWNNNKNEWSYVKAGRKKEASVATITTGSVSEAISSVTMTVDNILNVAKINSLKLYVASDEAFTSPDVYQVTPSVGTVEFEITSPASNRYYKIEVDCQSHGTKNGIIQVSKVTYLF